MKHKSLLLFCFRTFHEDLCVKLYNDMAVSFDNADAQALLPEITKIMKKRGFL